MELDHFLGVFVLLDKAPVLGQQAARVHDHFSLEGDIRRAGRRDQLERQPIVAGYPRRTGEQRR